jgi:hypothetical protein
MPNTDATLCGAILRTETPEFGVISITNVDADSDADILSHLMTEFPELQQLTYKCGVAKTEHDAINCPTDEADGETKPTADLKVDFDGDMYATPKAAPRSVARGKIGVKAEPAEEGEEEAGYHGLEDMNLDEALDAEACDEEGSEDGCGSIGDYGGVGELSEVDDWSIHDGEADEGGSMEEADEEQEQEQEDEEEDEEEDGEKKEGTGPMALCTTTTITTSSGRESRARRTFDPSESDSKRAPKKPRRAATARTTAQAAKKPRAAPQPRSPSTKKRKASQLWYLAIVGWLVDKADAFASSEEGRAFVSSMGADDDVLSLIIKRLLREAVRRMYRAAFPCKPAPTTLPLDHPTTRQEVFDMMAFCAPHYNCTFKPEVLAKLMSSVEPGPTQLFPTKPRDLLDLHITTTTGTCHWSVTLF